MTSSIRHASPLPVDGALPSYWRKSVDTIDNHRSTEILPTVADIVIIGAGYAGASIVHHLIEGSQRDKRPLPSIVLLEAREACSGATGRNGGHLKPDPIARAARVLETHGPDVAEHVAAFETRHVDEIKALVEREGIVCDFEETTLTDVCLHIPTRERIKSDIAKLLRANVSSAKAIQYLPESEAEKVSGVKGAVSCHKYHAARLWPYKLVAHLLAKAVSYGVNLQTNTPVISVSEAERGSGDHRWLVETPRGSISTDNVVYATNAYTSALIPEMKDKIVPVRGIVARLVGENAPKMTNSYMMRISEYEYDYMIPRPDGSIIVGGAKRDFYKNLHEWFNNSDDSKLIDGAKTYFDGYMQRHFLGWEDSNTRTEDIWTGIMGYSNDGFPYVGPACGRPGQYVCAGFTGHGMPQIFLSAKAIVGMLMTGNADNVDLPIPYRITRSRWSQSKEHDSLKMWQEVANSEHVHARL